MATESTILGVRPKPLRVLLTKGSDFYLTRTYKVDGVATNWPAGTTFALEFGDGTSWAATISGAVATFDVDQVEADKKTDGMTVQTVYTNGTTRRVWELGTVVRLDG